MAKHHVTTTINGDETEFLCETEQTLLDALRDELHMTGTKEGCGTGDCGACSIRFDGALVCACLVLAVEANGKQIETVVMALLVDRGLVEYDDLVVKHWPEYGQGGKDMITIADVMR